METRRSARGSFASVKVKASSLYGGKDPRDMPIYGIVDAAHYLRIPAVTLGTWVHGRSYPTYFLDPTGSVHSSSAGKFLPTGYGPCRSSTSMETACRELAPAAIVEVVTFVSLMQLVHRLESF